MKEDIFYCRCETLAASGNITKNLLFITYFLYKRMYNNKIKYCRNCFYCAIMDNGAKGFAGFFISLSPI